LPEPARGALDREALVARVRSTRLDVRAAEAAVATADRQLALERRRTIPDVEAGVSLERPESGASVDALLGPTAAVELPLFDRNHAQVRRAEFRRDELRLEYEALACEVEQALRVAVDQADAAARAARFVTGELVPQADRSLALARTSYDLGDSTLLTLLESQRASLQARSANIEALLEAARARIDVERAAGASLDVLLGVAHP
jgi:cobalt-zinc-cadmium efflux system outer membrane protein